MSGPHEQYMTASLGTTGPLEYLDEHHAVQRLYKPDGSLFGLNDNHWDPERGRWCSGYVAFEAHPPWSASGHVLVQENPLTVTASLACRTCSNHGFITDGKWVGA